MALTDLQRLLRNDDGTYPRILGEPNTDPDPGEEPKPKKAKTDAPAGSPLALPPDLSKSLRDAREALHQQRLLVARYVVRLTHLNPKYAGTPEEAVTMLAGVFGGSLFTKSEAKQYLRRTFGEARTDECEKWDAALVAAGCKLPKSWADVRAAKKTAK